MIAGFTGTSQGMSLQQCLELRDQFEINDVRELHIGDCIGGDHQAYTIAVYMGMRVVGHPPDKRRKRAFLKYDHLHDEFPYLVRNHNIVDWVKSKSGIMFIGPLTNHEEVRSGTWATKRYAKKVGCHIHILRRG